MRRAVHAIAVGIVAALVCLLLAAVPSIAGSSLGDFLERWAWPIGILIGLLDYLGAFTLTGPTA